MGMLSQPEVVSSRMYGHEFWRYQPPDGIGVRIRTEPDIDGETTNEILEPGTAFAVDKQQRGDDGILYLRLADGRGWIMESKPGVGVMCVQAAPKTVSMLPGQEPIQQGGDERATLLATLRNQDVELGKIVPEVQKLRADYASLHREFVHRVDHLEARFAECHLIPEGLEHHEKTPLHLQASMKQDKEDEEAAKEKAESDQANAEKTEDEETAAAAAFISDIDWLLPPAGGKKKAAHHKHHQHTAQLDHSMSLAGDKKLPWDPTLPPGAKVVDIRVWEEEPGPRSFSAYSSHNKTCILAPEAKDECLRMRFRQAGGESEGVGVEHHKAPLRKAAVEDSHAMLESLPHWHAGPFRNVLGQCKNLFYLPRPPPMVCGEHLYWTPYGDYIEDRQPAYGQRQAHYRAPADFWQAREYQPDNPGTIHGVEVMERLQGYSTTVPTLDYTYRRNIEVPDDV